jgi:uncharacterized repeat protein (TIGR01451 family)
VVVAVAAFIMATPATAGPSATSPGALAVTASALPSEVLPGETTVMTVAVTNVGGSTLTAVTLTESLPAALTYVSGSVVAVRTSSPGLLVSAFDGVDLAAGDSLQVTFIVTVNPALAAGVGTLTATSIATSGTTAVASDTQTLTILKQALAWAYGEGSN